MGHTNPYSDEEMADANVIQSTRLDGNANDLGPNSNNPSTDDVDYVEDLPAALSNQTYSASGDGTNAIEWDSIAEYGGMTALTIEFWLNKNTSVGDGYWLCGKAAKTSHSSPYNHWGVIDANQNAFTDDYEMYGLFAGGIVNVGTWTDVNAGDGKSEWLHYAFRWDKDQNSGYGELVIGGATETRDGGTAKTVAIDANPSPSGQLAMLTHPNLGSGTWGYYPAMFAELRISDKWRTDAELVGAGVGAAGGGPLVGGTLINGRAGRLLNI